MGAQKIWVYCLAANSEGINHGDWVEVASVEEMETAIAKILEASPVETKPEWWGVADTENLPWLPSDASLATILEVARLSKIYGTSIIAQYLKKNCIHRWGEAYLGSHWQSLGHFASDYLGLVNPVPGAILSSGLLETFDHVAAARLEWRETLEQILDEGDFYYLSDLGPGLHFFRKLPPLPPPPIPPGTPRDF